MGIVPAKKPARQHDDVEKFLTSRGIDLTKVSLLGVRGYYRDSMGVVGKNDRMIFDDAIFVYSPTAFASFNFNTDPNGFRKGHGTGDAKGMAMLKPGIWRYQKGIHRGYQAFTQAGEVTVIRDGSPNYEDTGYFGINIHKGGATGTSSLGCQTVFADQWLAMKTLVYSELDRYNQKTFQYVLVDEADTKWNA